jgi:hypothetical protein
MPFVMYVLPVLGWTVLLRTYRHRCNGQLHARVDKTGDVFALPQTLAGCVVITVEQLFPLGSLCNLLCRVIKIE